MDTRKVVEKYFEYVNAGDWDSWLGLFAEDIVLIEPIGTARGIETLREGIAGLKKGYRQFNNYLLELFVNGNRAVALTHIKAVTAGGAPIDLKVANSYTVENGKIVHQENFLDSAGLKPFLEQKLD